MSSLEEINREWTPMDANEEERGRNSSRILQPFLSYHAGLPSIAVISRPFASIRGF
jgi:hypothetical protein